MAALQNTQHVSEFSPDGKLYAFINAEGKLKIWDTESNVLKQDYIPNLHLSAPCTCFTWINVRKNGQKENSKKKARKSLDHGGEISLYIALGTSKGGVGLYSYATGKIENYLKGDGHMGSITSICRFSEDTLYTCGEDCHVVEWSLAKGGQISTWSIGSDKPTCIVGLPQSNRILIGSCELKLWSTETQELEQTFTGHATNVNLLKAFKINGKDDHVLSTSKTDRTISLWSIKTGSKYKNAVATFLMADVAFFMSATIDAENKLKIAAVTRSGVVHLFIVDDAKSLNASKLIKPKVTIEIASDSADKVEPIDVITSSLNFSFKDQMLLIGYGDRQFLRFENIEYNTSEKNQVFIRQDPKKKQPKISASQKDKQLKSTSIILDGSVEYQTSSTVARKTKAIEMPMETRLENLSLGEAPQAKNVAQLLIQALHNGDPNLLRDVFLKTDEKVVRSTLQRLPPQYVAPLLNELTLLTQKKMANAQIAVVWLKLLLQTHASQLMALGTNELFSKFGPLLGIIEHRGNSIKQLSKLSGRLDLLVGQIKRNTEDDTLDRQNCLVYEDKDSDIELEKDALVGQWADEDDSDEEIDYDFDEDEDDTGDKMDMSE